MVLFPLSLEAIIKKQRFIKAKTLSFSQTFTLGQGKGRGWGQLGTPWAPPLQVLPRSGSSPSDRSWRLDEWFLGAWGGGPTHRNSSGVNVPSFFQLSQGWGVLERFCRVTKGLGLSFPGPQ